MFLYLRHQQIFKLLIVETGVYDQKPIRTQKLLRQRHRIPRCRRVSDDLINRKQPYPFLALRLVGGDFRVERLGDTVQRDAVIGLHHELLLQPQFLLEVLDLEPRS